VTAFEFRVTGLDRLQRATQNAAIYFNSELEKALLASAEKIRGDAIKSIARGKKTGKLYRVGSVLRRASAPGEAPANQTATLTGRFRVRYDRFRTQATLAVEEDGSVKYAKPLEFGTRFMEPRPFFFPAVRQNIAWIEKRMIEAVRRAIKRLER
jgi:HK97 gp10 family phage protein